MKKKYILLLICQLLLINVSTLCMKRVAFGPFFPRSVTPVGKKMPLKTLYERLQSTAFPHDKHPTFGSTMKGKLKEFVIKIGLMGIGAVMGGAAVGLTALQKQKDLLAESAQKSTLLQQLAETERKRVLQKLKKIELKELEQKQIESSNLRAWYDRWKAEYDKAWFRGESWEAFAKRHNIFSAPQEAEEIEIVEK